MVRQEPGAIDEFHSMNKADKNRENRMRLPEHEADDIEVHTQLNTLSVPGCNIEFNFLYIYI